MIKGEIRVGDILWCPNLEEIVEVKGFCKDHFGQNAVYYFDGKIEKVTTAYFVFKYFTKLGSIL